MTIAAVALLLPTISTQAGTGLAATLKSNIGFTKLVNEVSFYQNTDGEFNGLGRTLQIISINSFKLFTDFTFEFTGDFNWEMDTYENYDYYIELSIVKPIYKMLSLNYQQIHSTFWECTVHQFGIRLSL